METICFYERKTTVLFLISVDPTWYFTANIKLSLNLTGTGFSFYWNITLSENICFCLYYGALHYHYIFCFTT